MAQLIRGLDPGAVAGRVAEARERIAAAAKRAGRDPGEVELLAAVKYVALDELPVLAQAGIELVGENRAQELEAKQDAHPGRFRWHFIGQLQSRKVRALVPRVELIHSVATRSALEQLARHGSPDTRILLEIDVAGDPDKAGFAPAELGALLEHAPVTVEGLMTMPPLAARAEDSRRHFAALRELADAHGLTRLSMGTSQDYEVAVEEGATIVRLGSSLYA